jgi:hypothetical protein
MTDIDLEWEHFISSNYTQCSNNNDYDNNKTDKTKQEIQLVPRLKEKETKTPQPSELYISTTTKIAYLNQPIDLSIFWALKIVKYYQPMNGIIKKQMKFNFTCQEDLDEFNKKLLNEDYYTENVIVHIDNPSGRIKFKDIRKLSVGISSKDLFKQKCKQKKAFQYCFVIILRILFEDVYREFHIKIFNTGKIEIPGIKNDLIFKQILNEIVSLLRPHVHSNVLLDYEPDKFDIVLINSNFNCGYCINCDAMERVLRDKYGDMITFIYESCGYPGIQCKIAINNPILKNILTEKKTDVGVVSKKKEKKHISFMIFRTGSVLISGKCEEQHIQNVYVYLKEVFAKEYEYIYQEDGGEKVIKTQKTQRPRRVFILQ